MIPNEFKLQFEDILNYEECVLIIENNNSNLNRGAVTNGLSIYEDDFRTNYTGNLLPNPKIEKLLDKIQSKISKLTGLPIENQEPMQLLRYNMFEKFEEHHDSDYEVGDAYEKYGHRVYSCVIYLNSVKRGGETYFQNADIVSDPYPGKMVWWNNISKDRKILIEARHAAMPVTQGIKWAIVVWVREKSMRPIRSKVSKNSS